MNKEIGVRSEFWINMSIESRVDFRYDIMSKLSELGGVGVIFYWLRGVKGDWNQDYDDVRKFKLGDNCEGIYS